MGNLSKVDKSKAGLTCVKDGQGNLRYGEPGNRNHSAVISKYNIKVATWQGHVDKDGRHIESGQAAYQGNIERGIG